MSPVQIRQSDLASFARCAQQKHLSDRMKAGEFPEVSLSMTAFGSVVHHALHAMEQLHHQGAPDALERALATFDYYWDPANIAAITTPVTVWAARDTYSGLARKGRATLVQYANMLAEDKGKLLGLEVPFTLPYRIGDEVARQQGVSPEHTIHGTMDRLSLRRTGSRPYLNVEDYKSSKEQRYLRWNAQFTMYCFATTRPQFWTDAWGRDEGTELHEKFRTLPRRGTWINVNGGAKRKDAGYRGAQDFRRLEVTIASYVASCEAGIYPLSLSGETCEWCFSGDTEYWTASGVRTFAETVGTTQRVLVSTGKWVEAPIRQYGVSIVDRVTLKRGKSVKVVEAMPDHRWFVCTRSDDTRTETRTVLTKDLRAGDRLATATPRTISGVPISPIGVMAGVVYGDGVLPAGRSACELTLHDEKRDLVSYFHGCDTTTTVAVRTGREVTNIRSLPAFMKRPPDLDEARAYLLGWLAGYVATDGSVSGGQVVISSTSRASIELARAVAARVGIATYGVTAYQRITEIRGQSYDTTLYGVQLRSTDLPEGFLLRPGHATATAASGSLTWTVLSVEPGLLLQPVFCAEVPGYENFTLEGWINVSNCAFREGICGGVALPASDAGSLGVAS